MKPRVFSTVAAAWLAVLPVAAAAQAYPVKPIRLIVPFPPGGPNDVIGRIVGQKLTEAWGQTIVVENRGGAGGTIGVDAGAKSPPDGHTIISWQLSVGSNCKLSTAN